MFNSRQLDRIEKKLDYLTKFLGDVYTEVLLVPKKRVELSNTDENAPKKRKYVKSGKYSKKVTTKKK